MVGGKAPPDGDRLACTTGTARTLLVPKAAAGSRVDRFVAAALGVSRSELQRWIEHGSVTVDGSVRSASAKLRAGEIIAVESVPASATAAVPDHLVRFEVLHSDDVLVVVNKPAGLVVHPARGHASGTLVNGLLALGLFNRDSLDRLGAEDAHFRPGIVHRLDKGTSGVMVVARTPDGREGLKAQFQAHTIERAYVAIAVGDVPAGTISTLHGRHPKNRLRFSSCVATGKAAVTHVRVLGRLRGATYVECRLETGRTHQIRVHLADGGHALLGDPLYGPAAQDPRVLELGKRLGHQALHAAVLGFTHPRTGARHRFAAPPPPDFEEALATLREPGA